MKKLLLSLILFSNLLFSAHAIAAESGSRHEIKFAGTEREYIVYRPAGLSRKNPVPLVIMLHGGFGSGEQAEKAYNWDAMADKQGFVVAYPEGTKRTWNAGKCCGASVKKNIDDLGFLTALIEKISNDENIDASRVYMTGMSNGAAMTYRYACEGSYPLAAIAPVAGGFSASCTNPHKVSLLHIHGMDDNHVPFTGGVGTKSVTDVAWSPVPKAIEAFMKANNCQPAKTNKTGLVQTSLANCEDGREVELITIDGAEHQWPMSQLNKGLIVKMFLKLDPPSQSLDATAVIWDFFKDKKSSN